MGLTQQVARHLSHPSGEVTRGRSGFISSLELSPDRLQLQQPAIIDCGFCLFCVLCSVFSVLCVWRADLDGHDMVLPCELVPVDPIFAPIEDEQLGNLFDGAC